MAGGDPDGAIKRRRSEMLLQRRVAQQAKVDMLTSMHACVADSPCGSNLWQSQLDRVSTSVYNVAVGPRVYLSVCVCW